VLQQVRKKRGLRGVLLVVATAVCSSACVLVLDLKDKVYVDTSAAEGGTQSTKDGAPIPPGAAPDATRDAEPSLTSCPSDRKGTPLVFIGGKGCIDATEVTQEQYAAFLAAKGGGVDVTGQPPQCSWNLSFKPGSECAYDAASNDCGGVSCKLLPQACVDWCDAYAYCTWAGKHLCGDPAGGPASLSSLTDPNTSLWTMACTSNGKHLFPYADAYQALTCASSDLANVAQQVATLSECHSKEPGYEAVFDLSGNVAEWEDACLGNGGQNDECRMRGGSFERSGDPLRCDAQFAEARSFIDRSVGFRCCVP
jgi:formylglycine-generating enzyme required for sulfatase activity